MAQKLRKHFELKRDNAPCTITYKLLPVSIWFKFGIYLTKHCWIMEMKLFLRAQAILIFWSEQTNSIMKSVIRLCQYQNDLTQTPWELRKFFRRKNENKRDLTRFITMKYSDFRFINIYYHELLIAFSNAD